MRYTLTKKIESEVDIFNPILAGILIPKPTKVSACFAFLLQAIKRLQGGPVFEYFNINLSECNDPNHFDKDIPD